MPERHPLISLFTHLLVVFPHCLMNGVKEKCSVEVTHFNLTTLNVHLAKGGKLFAEDAVSYLCPLP